MKQSGRRDGEEGSRLENKTKKNGMLSSQCQRGEGMAGV